MSWLKRIIDFLSADKAGPEPEKVKAAPASKHPLHIEEGSTVSEKPKLKIPTERQIVSYWLKRSGVKKPSADDIKFITLVSAVPARAVWRSPAFAEIIAKANLTDAEGAWFKIVKPCNQALSNARSLRKSFKHGLIAFEFLPSNALAGPCPKAAALEGVQLFANDVELAPFDECTHPSECCCMYKSCLLFLDED